MSSAVLTLVFSARRSKSTCGKPRRLSSRSSMEGYYFKPRMDRELLQTYGSGLIATTGCPSGEVQTRLRLGQYDAARAAAAEFQDIFGKENYFAEIMDHGLSIERRVMTDLLRLAKDLDIPLVATNDSHYTHQHEADAHEALLCVQSGSTLDDPNRFKFAKPQIPGLDYSFSGLKTSFLYSFSILFTRPSLGANGKLYTNLPSLDVVCPTAFPGSKNKVVNKLNKIAFRFI